MMILNSFQNRWVRWAALLLLASVCLLGSPVRAAAQDAGATEIASEEQAASEPGDPEPAVAGPVAGPAAGAAVTANDVNDVARQLWCPLCSGVRLDACELKACAQMKDVIGEKLAGGEDAASIKNYFVAQYGPQVLGEPPMEGFNWLAWILPVLAVLAGGLFVLSRIRSGTRRTATASVAPLAPAAGDAYSRKLDEELKNYE